MNMTSSEAKPSGSSCILIAEDDLEMRKMLLWALKGEGYSVVECPDGDHLMEHLGLRGETGPSHAFDLVIADVRMPGVSGLSVLERRTPCPPPLPSF